MKIENKNKKITLRLPSRDGAPDGGSFGSGGACCSRGEGGGGMSEAAFGLCGDFGNDGTPKRVGCCIRLVMRFAAIRVVPKEAVMLEWSLSD